MQNRGHNFVASRCWSFGGPSVLQPQATVPSGPTTQISQSGRAMSVSASLFLILLLSWQTFASAHPGESQVYMVQAGPGPQWSPSGHPNWRFWTISRQTSASAHPGRSHVARVQTGPGPQWRPSGHPNWRFWTISRQTSASAHPGRSHVARVQTGPGPQSRPPGQENWRSFRLEVDWTGDAITPTKLWLACCDSDKSRQDVRGGCTWCCWQQESPGINRAEHSEVRLFKEVGT